MSRDLELLKKYKESNSAPYYLLRDMIEQNTSAEFKTIDVVDLVHFKQELDELVEYLFVVKRFRQLNKKFKGKLVHSTSYTYFDIEGHQFQTLDEIEKVWNNRAFL